MKQTIKREIAFHKTDRPKNSMHSDIQVVDYYLYFSVVSEYGYVDHCRIDMTGQFDPNKGREVYALKSMQAAYLHEPFGRAEPLVWSDLMKRYKKWSDKNKELVSKIGCQEIKFLAFIESVYKVNHCNSWDSFREAMKTIDANDYKKPTPKEA